MNYKRDKNFPISWTEWDECQKYELDSWSYNLNNPELFLGIENHIFIGGFMGLEFEDNKVSNARGKRIIEYGAGVVGYTVRSDNLGPSFAVEPLNMPQWVKDRYEQHNIKFIQAPGEIVNLDFLGLTEKLDESWMAGVLQHVLDPIAILENMANTANLVRISEWVDLPPHEGHPWTVTEDMITSTLDKLGSRIKVEKVFVDQMCHTQLRGWLVNVIYDTSASNKKL